MSPLACGLVHTELHRGDGSLGGFLAMHSGPARHSIATCGSAEPKQRCLAAMSTVDKIGAFALTARSFKDAGQVLAGTRGTCAWMALGHATAG